MMQFGGNFGQPGQRVTSRQDRETEVRITVTQAAWASGIAAVLALVARFAVIIPLVRAINRPWWYAIEPRVSGWLLVGAAVVPWALLVVSFAAQVLNINFPPTYSAANPSNGFFGGMFGRKDFPIVAEEYQGRVPSVDAREITANLLVGNKQEARPVKITLPLDDWARLRRYIEKGQRSVSEADLVKYGGFSSGPNGRAREIGDAFKHYEGATERGRKGKPLIVKQLCDWILARGYGEASPTLPQIKAV